MRHFDTTGRQIVSLRQLQGRLTVPDGRTRLEIAASFAKDSALAVLFVFILIAATWQ